MPLFRPQRNGTLGNVLFRAAFWAIALAFTLAAAAEQTPLLFQVDLDGQPATIRGGASSGTSHGGVPGAASQSLPRVE